MANIKELEAKVAELEETNKQLTSKLEALEGTNNTLSLKLTAIATGKAVAVPIPGEIKVDLETPDGKKIKGVYQFRDGVRRLPMPDGLLVSSAALLRIANGGKATEEELTAFPRLREVNQEKALERIGYLISIGSTILQAIKS